MLTFRPCHPYTSHDQDFLTNIGLLGDDKHHLSVLNNVSGVLKPGRFTLLLGPPGGGKTTLLKALAGAARNGANGLNVSDVA